MMMKILSRRTATIAILLFGVLFLFSFKGINDSNIINENKFKTFKKDFYGTIGNLGVRMTLTIIEKNNGNVSYSGYYSYNHVGKNIKLNGFWIMRPGKPTYIELTEKVGGRVTGSFSLLPKSYDDYSTLSGNWYSANGKALRVSLKTVKK